MGLFAFKRLREREAALQEAASFHVESPPPADKPVRRVPRLKRQAKEPQVDQD